MDYWKQRVKTAAFLESMTASHYDIPSSPDFGNGVGEPGTSTTINSRSQLSIQRSKTAKK
ncbi:hypothetical protein M404DRAFT_1001437 [Pisolithus tinctorius Marx 270]|uniref:Uncharacterized protein n=1 Tax=Pisolithus tinctorius Marx 270 TaxID=870435 RepID=A0A0C3P7A6_PISTI|nr:hypothetical protein M404DRAFT_1001437 [Pisolithus tinctorius Marx 270]